MLLRDGFDAIQRPDGHSSYFRLSTRALSQPERTSDAWKAGAQKGAYWLVEPAPGAELAVIYTGVLAPEAIEAHRQLQDDVPGAGLLAVTSADVLHRDWMAASRQTWTSSGAGEASHIETLLADLAPNARLVTLVDGAPSTLSWIGSVSGMRLRALGVEHFGQTGDLPDLYAKYRLDADAVLDAVAELYA